MWPNILRPSWVIIKVSNVKQVIIKAFTEHKKDIGAICKRKLQAIFRRVRKIEEKRLLVLSRLSIPMSVRPYARTNLAPTGRVFMKFEIWVFFKTCRKNFKFLLNTTRSNGTLHEDQYTFLIISRLILLRMKNVSDESCRENKNTHFILRNSALKILLSWDNVEKYCTAGLQHIHPLCAMGN